MTSHVEKKTTIKVDRLFLAMDNPRHEEVDDEMEAIDLLCRTEDVDNLAHDIARHGTSPTERLIVYPIDEDIALNDIDDNTAFIVAEGNRRVCALKLLHDPDKAPAGIRPAIEKYSSTWNPIDELDAVVILDPERRRHWLKRIHDGVQGGKGRKPWNAEQRTRFSGSKRNIIAQALFDYAERHDFMTAADRKGSFSHMARLVGNVLVADTLGLVTDNGLEDIQRNRPKEEFDIILKTVLKEAFDKKLGSQARKHAIDSFARELQQLPGVTPNRIESEPLNPEDDESSNINGGPSSSAGGTPSQPPKRPEYVRQEKSIADGLKEVGSEKLESLYFSICKINVKHHTPLIAVGVWSFFESLAASIGKNENTPFKDFLSRGKMSTMRLGKGKALTAMSDALGRVASFGNVTKHHSVAAHFDYSQIVNDLKTLEPLILACIEEMKADG